MVTEEDTFSATSIGFHFVLGLEMEIIKNSYLTVELFQNFGFSSLVKDSTLNANTNSTGATVETSRADELQLNFSGTQIFIGLRRFL